MAPFRSGAAALDPTAAGPEELAALLGLLRGYLAELLPVSLTGGVGGAAADAGSGCSSLSASVGDEKENLVEY